jgi:hypothetical protein
VVRWRHHRRARVRLGPALTLVSNLGNLFAWEIRFGDCLIHCLSCSTPPIVLGVDARKIVEPSFAAGAGRHRLASERPFVDDAPGRSKA